MASVKSTLINLTPPLMKKQLLATMLCCAATLPQAWAVDAVLCGSVYNTADAGFAPGVYELPMSTVGTFKLKGSTADYKATGGGFFADDVYYVGTLNNQSSSYGSIELYPFDTEEWKQITTVSVSVSPAHCGMVSGYAVSPSDGRIFGCSTNTDRAGFFLYSYVPYIDNYDLDKTLIGSMERQLGAMAADADGKLFGIDAEGILYTVDSADGSMIKVGDTGVKPLVDGEFVPFIHASSIFDTATGKMYMAAQATDASCSLYEVNTNTGAATKLADYPGGYVVSGLYMAEGEAEAGAPAAATELNATFAPGSLSGIISFKAPGTTYGGDELMANLDFRVLANGKQIESGKVYSNVERSVDVTVPERGTYEFKVIMSNASGDGPAAKIKAAVGYAAPDAPVVTTNSYGSSVQIQWNDVTTTADGTPLDGTVSYRVVRYPDGKVIEESSTWTSCWDTGLGDELKAYQYGVTAFCNDTPSEEGYSPVVVAGSAQPPYTESFDEPEVMNLYTIIDANNDSRTWEFYYGEVRSQASDEVDGDDWLMSPPMNLQSGKYYMVSLDARVYNPELPGKFEIFAGDAPTPEAMTTAVIPASEVVSESLTTYKGIIAAQGYGNKYIGIHSITEKGNWWLFATNFTVSAAYEGTVPAAPTDFTARSSSDGSNAVTLSLKAPTTDLAGNSLSSIDKIEIMRGSKLIHTVSNPAPGATIEYVDNEGRSGENTYTATATNYSGTGMEASAVGFAGINIPAGVTEAVAYSTDVPGEVIVEWKPVTTFADGTPMDPDLVTYCIYTNVTGNDMKILDKLTGTSAKFQIMYPTEEEPQLFFQFGVTAETAGGENTKGVLTDFVALGEPYELPYEDSFANLKLAYLSIQGGSDSYSYWDNASDVTFEEVQSQDNDNGMIAMFSQYKNSSAYFKTGIIDLADAKNPMLTFYVFNLVDPNLPDNNTIEVQIGEHNTFTSVKTITLSDFGTEAWHRVEIPLTEFAGKEIQVNLIGTVNSYQYIHVDNLKVMDRHDHDMAITAVSVPERVKAGNCANLSVNIANLGLNNAAEITLDLMRDGEVVDTKSFADVASDARLSHVFPAMHSVAMPESVEYQVQLSYTKDMVADNNMSQPVQVMTIYPNYPTVTDLTATYTEADDKAVTLSWSEPDLTADFADDITEGFESAAPWRNRGIEGWTFVDADKMYIYGFSFFELPAYAPQPESLQSWFTFTDTYEPMAQHFSDPGFYQAHGGNQYIGSMAVTTGDPDYTQRRTDDWAISPLLYGGKQTISLWAKSMLADALEQMEVLYSTTGTELTDFKLLLNVNEVPWAWTQYFVELPEGTKYFAIRNHSRDAYVLMVDDVNFTPASTGADLEVSGYNVYRDGVRINTETVTGTKFADTLTGTGTPEYTVTTLYANRGESSFSNVATPELMGIDDAALASVRIFAAPGCINVTGAYDTDIAVYSIDGRLISLTAATGHDCIAATTGTYIVKVGQKVAKISVR